MKTTTGSVTCRHVGVGGVERMVFHVHSVKMVNKESTKTNLTTMYIGLLVHSPVLEQDT